MASDCRNCPPAIRERCIQQASTSPSVKMMMRGAFAAGTDTQQMWGLLQMNCLLVPKGRAAGEGRSGALMHRLGLKEEPVVAEAEVAAETVEAGASSPPSVPARPMAAPEPLKKPASALRPTHSAEKRERPSPLRYCLSSRCSRHRIALPARGELVLGRFDPETGVTPDVDLTFEDRGDYLISRRHARIVGRDGRYEIEDLGSTNGTAVNGRMLRAGQSVLLQPGDLVTLGNCEFVYNPISEISAGDQPLTPYLLSTFTGRRFLLPLTGEVVVGRGDPTISRPPDIDLGTEGDAAGVVACRHVKIVGHNGRHYVEDLGSAGGTKLNGVRLRFGELSLLNPGDHIWLGGCVLAYDVER